MKIRNYEGRSWISDKDVNVTVHITNATVESAELKGQMLVIRVTHKRREE